MRDNDRAPTRGAPTYMRVHRHRDRHSLRLQGYDYSQPGAYFITVCTQDRACLFGDVVDGVMCLNDAGRSIETEWNHMPDRFPTIKMDGFITMPNHVHGIIIIVGAGLVPAPGDRAPTRGAPTIVTPTLSDIVGAFKSLTTVAYIRGVRQHGWPPFDTRFWQRNFHDHVIRDPDALQRIREYIAMNPARWQTDPNNPGLISKRAASAADGDIC